MQRDEGGRAAEDAYQAAAAQQLAGGGRVPSRTARIGSGGPQPVAQFGSGRGHALGEVPATGLPHLRIGRMCPHASALRPTQVASQSKCDVPLPSIAGAYQGKLIVKDS